MDDYAYRAYTVTRAANGYVVHPDDSGDDTDVYVFRDLYEVYDHLKVVFSREAE